MYLSHFGLRELPFSITPDPRFLYMSARHREALAHLVYGVGEHGGFVQLTGEVGTGKTSVCRCLLEQLPSHVDLALVLNPRLSPVELLATVCDELRIPYPAGTSSAKELVDRLHRHLLDAHAAGRRTVLIIDEAQNLAPEVLEEVRLLTNLETAREKLLQVDPDRPARADGDPRSAEAPPARPADHGSLPPRAALARGDPRLRPPPARRGGPGRRGVHGGRPCGRCTAGRAAFPASSTPSPTARLLGAYTRSAPQSMPRRCGARRPRCWAILRRRGGGGRRRAAAAALVAATGGGGLVLLAPGELGRDEARSGERRVGPGAGHR